MQMSPNPLEGRLLVMNFQKTSFTTSTQNREKDKQFYSLSSSKECFLHSLPNFKGSRLTQLVSDHNFCLRCPPLQPLENLSFSLPSNYQHPSPLWTSIFLHEFPLWFSQFSYAFKIIFFLIMVRKDRLKLEKLQYKKRSSQIQDHKTYLCHDSYNYPCFAIPDTFRVISVVPVKWEPI